MTLFNRHIQNLIVTMGGLLLVLLVVLVDLATGTELDDTILYLIPVVFATWFSTLRIGLFMSVASCIAQNWVGHVEHPKASELTIMSSTLVHLGFFVITAWLLGRLQTSFQHEKLLARTDLLTGMLNRRAFYESVEREIRRAGRNGKPLTAAYLDLDNFKQVNDRLGHKAGDEILCLTAEIILASTRATDSVARLGGDEFALLLPETGSEGARSLLNRLHARLLQEIRRKEEDVGCSIGMVTFCVPPADAEEFVHRADTLMYAVKADGKNAIRHEVVEAVKPERQCVASSV